ncbi:MAG: endonuclease/exonuclease/phosphatase family protein [Thermodesulfobacteriota bacterium]
MKSVRRSFLLVSMTVFLLAVSMLAAPLATASADGDGAAKIKTMTRNLYLGADIFKVVEAAQDAPDNPLAVPIAVSEVYHTMLFTNFWARAEAIADEMAEHNPDVVGLQEVSTFYKQTPGDFLEGNPKPAEFVIIDFWEVLQAALASRGLEYEVYKQENADVEMPMVDFKSPTWLSDVRMVDHDMVLVKTKHDSGKVLSGNYQKNLALDLGGAEFEFTRGFLIVDAVVKGQDFRFVNTHLEVRGQPGSVFRFYQSAQMAELIGTINSVAGEKEKPIIMVGDFNSSSTDEAGVYVDPEYGALAYTPPYQQALAAGYRDAWMEQNEYDAGYTSGFDEYVSNPRAELTSRIDLIFVDPGTSGIDKVNCKVVGDAVSDMVPNPIAPRILRLWPSDHAGVVGSIQLFRQ